MNSIKYSLLFVFLPALVFQNGCGSRGPDVAFVEGVLTFDEKPLQRANIFFHPQEGEGVLPATGTTDEKGYYRLTSLQGGGTGKGAVPGKYLVTVTRYKDEPSRMMKTPTPDGGFENMPVYDSMIPEKYTSIKSSDIIRTVAKGKNRFDIVLESK